jgi:hypothetical protein
VDASASTGSRDGRAGAGRDSVGLADRCAVWAHVAAGLVLVALVALHLHTRRRLPWRGAPPRHQLAYGMFIVAATAMAASGLLRLAGVPPQYVWHGGISYTVLGLMALHVWSIRRALRARVRRRKGIQHE